MLDAQVKMLNEALIEIEGVYGIVVPIQIGDHVSMVAKLILGGMLEGGVDESIYDYWKGNFASVGL